MIAEKYRLRLRGIPLVDYSRGEEIVNTLTHAAGLVLCGFIFIRCVVPAFAAGDRLREICACLYLFGTLFTFCASAVYHAFPKGDGKRFLRLLDHCAIFFAVAGTASGCVPAVYDTVGLLPSVVMTACAWLGAAEGLFFTFRDFEGSRAVQMVTYIATGAVCAISGAGAYRHLPGNALWALFIGSAFLLIGAVLCGVGKRVRFVHGIFHLTIDAGLTVYFLGIQAYCY